MCYGVWGYLLGVYGRFQRSRPFSWLQWSWENTFTSQKVSAQVASLDQAHVYVGLSGSMRSILSWSRLHWWIRLRIVGLRCWVRQWAPCSFVPIQNSLIPQQRACRAPPEPELQPTKNTPSSVQSAAVDSQALSRSSKSLAERYTTHPRFICTPLLICLRSAVLYLESAVSPPQSTAQTPPPRVRIDRRAINCVSLHKPPSNSLGQC